MVQEPLSGLRVETPSNLVLDAGAIFANIDVEDLEATGWDAAIAAATAIGATRGNATFNANRELREVDVNGTLGAVRGLVFRNEVRPTLTATLIEITAENLGRMIAGGQSSPVGEFSRFSGQEIEDASYFNNIALAATVIGSDEPLVLVLFNVLVHTSPDFEFEDHNELGVEVEFVAHFPLEDPRNELSCWRVYRPLAES